MLFRSLLLVENQICNRLLMRGLNTKSSWDVMAGVCVERLPAVTPPLSKLQKKYKDFLYTNEVEKSLKSDHEVRHENDKKQAELIKKESADMEAVSKITAQDFEDAATEELSNFKFAPIETEADKNGDKTSIERCLQRHLVLVSQVKLGKDLQTILPQGGWREGETMRQTAERVLLEQCGPDLKVQFLGNAPCGFYKYKYPAEINGKIGAKVFFYYANYKTGNVATKDMAKVNWLNRKELDQMLPERYKKSVSEFLIEEFY